MKSESISQKGYVQLLIVVLIIGIMAVIVLTYLNGSRDVDPELDDILGDYQNTTSPGIINKVRDNIGNIEDKRNLDIENNINY